MEDKRSYLPPEWGNEERLRVLLGPMPSPQEKVAHTARVTFWGAAIHQWCRTTKRLTFMIQDTLAAFRRGTLQPLCMTDVLKLMNGTGEILQLDQLPLGEQPQESWLGWGQRVFLAGPSRFAWTKLKKAIVGDNIQGIAFISTVVLQEMYDQVLKKYWEIYAENYPTNIAIALPHLYSKLSECVGSADNLHLIVETLAYEGRAATTTHHGTTYVKFALPGDTVRPAITLADLAENNLHCAQEQVEASINQLNTEVNKLQTEAKAALKAGSKIQAMHCLKRKKRIEKSLSIQMGALENVAACLQQLQETRINKQVLGAFKTGVEAIRASVSGGTSAENAASTMDDLQEVLEECQEINSVLSAGVKTDDDLDDASLQEELDELLSQDREADGLDQMLSEKMAGLVLPEVPSSNPLASIDAEEHLPSPSGYH